MLEFLLENDFISALLAFALVLIPAIIFHELGHFFAAKMIGVNVLEFGIGFPPRLAKLFMWGETEFTLNWLPLGGFVRPLGEDMIGPSIEPDDDYEGDEKPKHHYISEREELRMRGVRDEDMLSVNDAKPLPRIFFMFAGPLANFITAIFFFIIVALLGIPEFVGARIQLVSIAPESSLVGQVEEGDAIERINGEYFPSMLAFTQAMQSADVPITLTMRSLESNENYDVTFTDDVAFKPLVLITAVQEDSPAEDANLQSGDLILSVNGNAFPTAMDPVDELIRLTNDNAGKIVELTIRRDGEEFTLNLTPRLNPPPNSGRMGIGITSFYEGFGGTLYGWASSQEELIPRSLGGAIEHGFSRFFEVVGLIINLPSQLIEGTISPEEARPVSVVGISQVGGQFLQQSIRDNTPGLILDFLALISIFLGVTNLLPLPPLDGGRILFVVIEIIRGKPVPVELEYNIYRIGMIFLLSLGALIILYDIFNPFVLPS
jgi:regulator of sigma E protease